MLEAIRLLSKVPFERGTGSTSDEMMTGLNLELGLLGYAADASLSSALKTLGDDLFKAMRNAIVDALREIAGADAPHLPMFSGFPHSTPEKNRLITMHIMAKFSRKRENGPVGTDGNHRILSCGHAVRIWETSDLNGCPICGTLDASTGAVQAPTVDLSSVTAHRMLGHVDATGLAEAVNALLARQSSLSADERRLVRTADRRLLRMPDAIFRETVPIAYAIFGTQAAGHVRTATDVLRLAVHLSDPDADLSLAETVKFKLRTSQRRLLLRLLEAVENPAEDLLRHRDRWVRLGSMLKINDERSMSAAPAACIALRKLSRDPKSIPSFNRDVEEAMRARRIDSGLIKRLVARPGEFARRIDFMLRSANDRQIVFDALPDVLPKLTTKLLFELKAHLRYRNEAKVRVFHPKGMENKAHVVENLREPIAHRDMSRLRGALDDEIHERLSKLPPMLNVAPHGSLVGIPVPWNRRGDSTVSAATIKGARMPFKGETIRLFVHWTGKIDVDLSILLWNDGLDHVGTVAFTDLIGLGCKHSGDVLSAPQGASEYIDFKVSSLLAYGVRYVVSSLISFGGVPFSEFPCFAGFMQRDGVASGELYEPESVRHRFDVNQKGRSALPLIFDLKTREVIFADLSTGGGSGQAVRGKVDKHRALLQAMLDTPVRKPNMMDLMIAHANARGVKIVSEEDLRTLGPDDAEEILRDYGYGE